MTTTRFTCPCCGYRTLPDFPGSFCICNVCYWEDDPVQLLDPAYRGGANTLSLLESQVNYGKLKVSDVRFSDNVRPPGVEESRDPEWRPAVQSDLARARTPASLSDEEYRRLETWYYWKKTP